METAEQEVSPFLNVSEKGIEALYAFGYHLYENGLYQKALHFFRSLTLLSPKNAKYWKSLAATYQMLRDFDRAVEAYGVAALLEQEDPLNHWHASECFIALKKEAEANEATDAAEFLARQAPQKYPHLLDKIRLIRKTQKKERKRT